jgi:hypothetical protein
VPYQRTGIAWSTSYYASNNHYSPSSTYTYDGRGNVTSDSFNTYTWDPYNKMSSINSTACGTNGECATYDAFGRMVEFSKNSTYKENWYTQTGVAVMSGTTLTESYLSAPGGGTFMEVGTSGQNDYLHKDWLGNVRIASLIANQTVGADLAYAPYGEVYNVISGSTVDQMFTWRSHAIGRRVSLRHPQPRVRVLEPGPLAIARSGWGGMESIRLRERQPTELY